MIRDAEWEKIFGVETPETDLDITKMEWVMLSRTAKRMSERLHDKWAQKELDVTEDDLADILAVVECDLSAVLRDLHTEIEKLERKNKNE